MFLHKERNSGGAKYIIFVAAAAPAPSCGYLPENAADLRRRLLEMTVGGDPPFLFLLPSSFPNIPLKSSYGVRGIADVIYPIGSRHRPRGVGAHAVDGLLIRKTKMPQILHAN